MPRKTPQTMPPSNEVGAVVFRMADIDRAAADMEGRSFPIVLATEAAVRTYDFARGEVVDEVIRVSGIEFPLQVPLVDTHDRSTVRSVLGSIRDLDVSGGRLMGRAYFAADDVSRTAFQNYIDGHLTDFSIGARSVEASYEGKRKIIARSQLLEGSAVVRGADPNCKALLAMRAYADPEGLRNEIMDAKLRELLVSRGLAADANDTDTVEFLRTELAKADHGIDAKLALEAVAKLTPKADDKIDRAADAVKMDRKRVAEIDELCRANNVGDDSRRKWVADGTSADDVARAILKGVTGGTGEDSTGAVKVGKEAIEKLSDAIGGALVSRFLQATGKRPESIAEAAKARGDYDAVQRSEAIAKQVAAPGVSDFRYASIGDIAERLMRSAGQRVDGLTRPEIIRRAIQHGDINRDAAYHTTGSFPNLMLDAQNKLLLAAYDDQPVTYSTWVRTAPSVADFKQMHRVRFGELPNPQVVPENSPYNESTTTDTKESYRVEKYGDIFSVSMEAMVNDDLNAMTRLPAMHGSAMRRKINASCYGILTSNPTMSDGVALFHASSHGANLDTTALAESAVDVGFVVMMTQTGVTSNVILNIRPRYLIVPPALASTAYRIVDPRVFPTASSGVKLYSTDGPQTLQVVVDAELSSSQSATLWFIAADPSQIDTVEITFLQGEESPVLEREVGFNNDSMKFKIRQTFGVKAIDYRGLYQGNT